MQINTAIAANGKGLWSNTATSVYCTVAELAYCTPECDFGELRVYYDTDTWAVNTQGLVYTDPGFLKNLKGLLTSEGINVEDLGYSEAGMQDDDYVSFDVGAEFIRSWLALGH
jgi:hypothetical protein